MGVILPIELGQILLDVAAAFEDLRGIGNRSGLDEPTSVSARTAGQASGKVVSPSEAAELPESRVLARLLAIEDVTRKLQTTRAS
jgi:hypothetical protein